jgi:hypothetical protein
MVVTRDVAGSIGGCGSENAKFELDKRNKFK